MAQLPEKNSVSSQTFIKGVDISTFQALEDKGVKFSQDGKTQDLLQILKHNGVNYVRLRVWNNPVEAGGYNDEQKLIAMAVRVKAAGLKLLVDFHYSDFWADPGKQVKPAAWNTFTFPQLQQAVYSYTQEVLTGLKSVDAFPDMVQIGNEINSGILHPEGSTDHFDQLAALLGSGIQAVRDTTPKGHQTQIMLHLANGGNNAEFRSFFDQVTAHHLDYDVIGLSYYPYWHGTFQQLKTNLDDLAVRYHKPLVVAETAYPYTLENGDASDGNIAGLEQTQTAGFPASVANQKLVVATVMNTVAHVTGGEGLGVFYWEPAWIPGVGWRQGDFNSWENQALFDFHGNALDSLKVFQDTPDLLSAPAPITVYPASTTTVTQGTVPTLPSQVSVLYSEGSIKPVSVTWPPLSGDQFQTLGTKTLEGTVAGLSQKASIEVKVVGSANLVQNPGFENDLTNWTLSDSLDGKIDSNAGNAHSGTKAFNYWNASAYAFTLSQHITGLSPGTYTLHVWASGLGGETKASLFVSSPVGTALETPITNTGWNNWKQYTLENIQITGGDLTVGFKVEAPEKVWGFFDDVELTRAESKP